MVDIRVNQKGTTTVEVSGNSARQYSDLAKIYAEQAENSKNKILENIDSAKEYSEKAENSANLSHNSEVQCEANAQMCFSSVDRVKEYAESVENNKTIIDENTELVTTNTQVCINKAEIATTQAQIATQAKEDTEDIKETALENITTAETIAINNVDNAKTISINAIEQVKNLATTEIILSKDYAISNINTTKTEALSEVEQAKNTAIIDIENEVDIKIDEVEASAKRASDSADSANKSEIACLEVLSKIGTAIKIKGRVNAFRDLPKTGNLDGDAYLVGEDGLTSYPEYYWYQNHWEFLGSSSGGASEFSQLQGNPYDNQELADELNSLNIISLLAVYLQDSLSNNLIEKKGLNINIRSATDVADTQLNYTGQQINELLAKDDNSLQKGYHDGTKQDIINDLDEIRENAIAGKEASDTIGSYGNIVTHNTSEFQPKGDYATNTALAETDAIAKGATQATSFPNYKALVDELSTIDKDKYRIGQNFYIETLGVPDVWIYSVEQTSQPYTYTTDEAIAEALKVGTLHIGYYKISQLETQKVDLTNYVERTELDDYAKLTDVDNPYWVTYGTTTYAEITEAINAGKDILLWYSGYLYMYGGVSSNYHYFVCNATHTSIRYARVNTSNDWGANSTNLLTTSSLIKSTTTTASTDSFVYSALALDNMLQGVEVSNTTDTTVTLAVEKAKNYIYTQPLTSLTISSVEASYLETTLIFTAGTGIQVTFPETLQKVGEPTFKAGKKYILCFWNNTVVVGEVA